MESLSSVGEPDQYRLSGAQLQFAQFHTGVCRQSAGVGADHHRGLLRKRSVVQLQHCGFFCPVEGSDVTHTLIPDPQVSHWRGGVREKDKVSIQQGALLPSELTQSLEKGSGWQSLSSRLLCAVRRQWAWCSDEHKTRRMSNVQSAKTCWSNNRVRRDPRFTSWKPAAISSHLAQISQAYT